MSIRFCMSYCCFLLMLAWSACTTADKPDTAKPAEDTLYSGPKFNEHIRSTTARTPEEERLGFKLPEGFEVSLYASEPDIGKPINITFDERGRMWVTQSYEYPFPATPGKGRDRITVLEDTNHDGRADKFTVFSDTLNIPIGILPYRDGAFAFSIPNLSFYEDSDNDGKADRQKKILGPFQHRDTHGMVNNFIRGYDGWIHACHGYTNRSTVAGSDGDSIRMISGNTFRYSPDGKHAEHMTHGRINPFGLAWDERGYLYSTDCHTSPLYQLIKGGDYYQWGKEEDMGFAPDMKPMEDEATALCGIAYYGDNLFPESYQKNFYIGDAVSCRVYRNSFSFNGSSPVGKKEENFVLSADPWFRPVDIKLGPDGALYIADFYNSIIGHYEVPLDHPKRDKVRGRIWRITYKGKTNPALNLATANTDELIKSLDAENITVRMKAADQLTDRIGKPAAERVLQQLNAEQAGAREKSLLLWVLHRVDALDDATLKKYAGDADPLLRLHALRIIAERKSPSKDWREIAYVSLGDQDPHVRRVATEILQQFPDMESVEKLIGFRQSIPETDNHMIYSVRLSLRNMLRHPELMHAVVSGSWTPEQSAVLATVLVGVQTNESGELMYSYLKKQSITGAELPKVVAHIARFTLPNQATEVVELARTRSGDSMMNNWTVYTAAQKGISQRGGKEPENMSQWGRDIASKILNFKNPDTSTEAKKDQYLDMRQFAISLAGKYNIRELSPMIAATAKDRHADQFIRIEALRALLKMDISNIDLVQQGISDPESAPDFKRRLVTMLGEFPGDPALKVLAGINTPPPDMQQPLIMSMASMNGGKELVFEKVRKGEIYSRILAQPQVRERILLNSTEKVRSTYEELVANIAEINREKQSMITGRVSDFNSAKANASPDAGRIVFQKNCALCHSINNEGGMIGPQLNGVGKWGAQSLAEKILDPNRNISESFRTYSITLKSGKLLSGLFRREEGETFVFADALGKEFSVNKKDIKERKASSLTLMPDQFENTIPQSDFNNLLAYLLTIKN